MSATTFILGMLSGGIVSIMWLALLAAAKDKDK